MAGSALVFGSTWSQTVARVTRPCWAQRSQSGLVASCSALTSRQRFVLYRARQAWACGDRRSTPFKTRPPRSPHGVSRPNLPRDIGEGGLKQLGWSAMGSPAGHRSGGPAVGEAVPGAMGVANERRLQTMWRRAYRRSTLRGAADLPGPLDRPAVRDGVVRTDGPEPRRPLSAFQSAIPARRLTHDGVAAVRRPTPSSDHASEALRWQAPARSNSQSVASAKPSYDGLRPNGQFGMEVEQGPKPTTNPTRWAWRKGRH